MGIPFPVRYSDNLLYHSYQLQCIKLIHRREAKMANSETPQVKFNVMSNNMVVIKPPIVLIKEIMPFLETSLFPIKDPEDVTIQVVCADRQLINRDAYLTPFTVTLSRSMYWYNPYSQANDLVIELTDAQIIIDREQQLLKDNLANSVYKNQFTPRITLIRNMPPRSIAIRDQIVAFENAVDSFFKGRAIVLSFVEEVVLDSSGYF